MECLRCGRPLKDKKSREREYGPKCWKKRQKEVQEHLKLFEEEQEGEQDVSRLR